MGGKVGSSSGPMGDINVTPLIDVVLVLLVVFMVITPMLESGKAVDLPVSTQAVTVNDTGQHIVVSITADGRWWVEQEEALEDDLVTLINIEFRKRPESTILVKADRGLRYEQVRTLMDLLAENRWTSIKLATGKES
jgi:biopolymer transport protein ExbD/biopolymer transport protein TolR